MSHVINLCLLYYIKCRSFTTNCIAYLHTHNSQTDIHIELHASDRLFSLHFYGFALLQQSSMIFMTLGRARWCTHIHIHNERLLHVPQTDKTFIELWEQVLLCLCLKAKGIHNVTLHHGNLLVDAIHPAAKQTFLLSTTSISSVSSLTPTSVASWQMYPYLLIRLVVLASLCCRRATFKGYHPQQQVLCLEYLFLVLREMLSLSKGYPTLILNYHKLYHQHKSQWSSSSSSLENAIKHESLQAIRRIICC